IDRRPEPAARQGAAAPPRRDPAPHARQDGDPAGRRPAQDPPGPAAFPGPHPAPQRPGPGGQALPRGGPVINLYSGLFLYVVATGFALWALRSGDPRGLQTARFGALLGAIDHIVYLVRIGAKTGHFPVTGAIEAYVFLSTAVILIA